MASEQSHRVRRFVLFTYDQYYPGGGWHDKAGDFDSVEEARMFMRDVTADLTSRVYLGEYYDIVDLWTDEIVESGDTPERPPRESAYTEPGEARDARIEALRVAMDRMDKSLPWYTPVIEGATKGYCVLGSLIRRAAP